MQPALAPHPSAQDHADQAQRTRSCACCALHPPNTFHNRRLASANIKSLVLHDQLLAAQHQHLTHPQQARPQPPAPQPPHMQPNTPARDQNNIDPAISGATMLTGPPQTPTQPDVTGQETPKTYGKRPLSTSKRAAQNRAAQRAFRQRKEAHIRELEGKVKAYESMGEAIKALQAENYQLREYIINLQSRLLDSQGEVPELPGNIDLSQPRSEIPVPPIPNSETATTTAPPPTAPQQPQPSHAQAPTSNDDMNSLNRIAVAGLGMRKPPTEEANYLGNNFQAQARRVRPDEGQPEASELPKQEQTHGLPLIS
ncbi:hypothetical protein KXV74_003323 [Aspergillus fumigatus]|nr:hypothetical protein KXX32_000302 [Aspergillus fumigatus]KAH2024119.1 hypothetical protein KXV65_009560 [Aspergillus fumigatus]KAH2167270.1 hypothetical protein KXV74_003323 [Aspergillus fumigatus]KAH2257613.1 hypothetical protein KXW26_000534 [Aspergillus fumigatus]KAH2484321.1 hypothetical protein KXV28_003111 [Aspergillus fumigatus]